MSRYINKNSLFLEPQTDQYGSHMVMSNVHKSAKTRYVNIDTLFSEEMSSPGKKYTNPLKYTITIPESINCVNSIKIISAEIPITFFTITALLGNNTFTIARGNPANNTTIVIAIPDGNYTITTIATAVNSALSDASATDLKFTFSGKKSVFWTTQTYGYKLIFDAMVHGPMGTTNYKSKLGWILGFRQTQYSVPLCKNPPADLTAVPTSSALISETDSDLYGMRYGYLVVDEFVNGAANSMTSLVGNSFMNKKILARVAFDSTLYHAGTICYVNEKNGALVSDIREYSGNVNILKLNVQLVNCFGDAVDLNGAGMSFILKIECE